MQKELKLKRLKKKIRNNRNNCQETDLYPRPHKTCFSFSFNLCLLITRITMKSMKEGGMLTFDENGKSKLRIIDDFHIILN